MVGIKPEDIKTFDFEGKFKSTLGQTFGRSDEQIEGDVAATKTDRENAMANQLVIKDLLSVISGGSASAGNAAVGDETYLQFRIEKIIAQDPTTWTKNLKTFLNNNNVKVAQRG